MIAWEQTGLSRRDRMMVARHEMPGNGSCLPAFQALHAWLPSLRPSGTVLAP
jgi:hypothetical protein